MGVKDKHLAIAIKEQWTKDAARLLTEISDVDFQTYQRRTALHTAVKYNNIAVARMLLKMRARMNILPKNKAHQTVDHSPMLLAFQMGESHEEMQLLFLRYLKVVRDSWQSDDDKKIMKWIPMYAMQFSSPRVFFEATRKNGVESLRDAKGITHLMHMMRRVTLFCTDPTNFTKKMQNVSEIVNKYPDMAWERLKCQYESELGTEAKNFTALGILVFHNLKARQVQNLKIAALGDTLKLTHAALMPNNTTLFGDDDFIETDKKNNVTIMKYLETEFIPDFFTMMLRPMRIALAMATHTRLSKKEHCWAALLHTDTIDMIFNALIRDIVHSPSTLKTMLC